MVDSVHAFVHSRDLHQSLLRFRFRSCCRSCYMTDVYTLVTTAAPNRLQELDLLKLPPFAIEPVPLPSALLSCKTLVVLKLTSLRVEAFSFVDLPSLKILHLMKLYFPEHRFLADLEVLSGCPNVEDLIVNDIDYMKCSEIPEFKNLPKLIRAVIDKRHIPIEVVYNVQFLRVHAMDEVGDYGVLLPEYPNLTHVELDYLAHAEDWPEVLRLLNHCPKVQSLVIIQREDYFGDLEIDDYGRGYFEFPRWVPKCLSLHLKTCCIDKYSGSERQYILQNAKVLEDMTIFKHRGEKVTRKKFKMIKRLSLCTRLSSTCKLSFS